ncbi:MAG: hypothetical protein WA269_05525 [Candidatus Udaeobacter sp.]
MDSWLEINHDINQADVWALVTNSSWHSFARTYFGGGGFRSTDDNWTPVNNALDCGNIWSLALDAVETICAGTAGCGTRIYCSTDNGDSWTLANIGLTSTNVAAKDVSGAIDLPAVT